jgi:DNA mismatch repair protein MutL
MMDFDDGDRLEIPVLGSPADHIPAMREPAVVRDRGYNPFTRYDAESGPTPAAEGHAGTDPENDYKSLICGDSVFEYISPAQDGAQGAFTGLDSGPRAFSAPLNIGEGYAAALYGGVFVAIDLRRAREAVLFDRFAAMLRGGHSATQQLLFPERMALSADDAELLRDHNGEFAALGFDIRAAGEHSFEIYGTPADMPSEALDEAVYGMLDELRDGIFAGDGARRERLAAVMARTGAGTSTGAARLSPAELAALLDALAATANPSFTPQGKPVVAEITLDEIRNKMR